MSVSLSKIRLHYIYKYSFTELLCLQYRKGSRRIIQNTFTYITLTFVLYMREKGGNMSLWNNIRNQTCAHVRMPCQKGKQWGDCSYGLNSVYSWEHAYLGYLQVMYHHIKIQFRLTFNLDIITESVLNIVNLVCELNLLWLFHACSDTSYALQLPLAERGNFIKCWCNYH